MIMPALRVEGGGGAAKVALASVFDGHMGYQVPAPPFIFICLYTCLFTIENIHSRMPASAFCDFSGHQVAVSLKRSSGQSACCERA